VVTGNLYRPVPVPVSVPVPVPVPVPAPVPLPRTGHTIVPTAWQEGTRSDIWQECTRNTVHFRFVSGCGVTACTTAA